MMKKEKSVKLALISLLSNPDVIIDNLIVVRDTESKPDGTGWSVTEYTQVSHYQFDIRKWPKNKIG